MDEIEIYNQILTNEDVSNLDKLNPCIMENLMKKVTEGLVDYDWKKRVFYLQLIKKLKELYPTYIVRCLPDIVIKLRDKLQDLKQQVKGEALSTLKDICSAIKNPDIQPSMEAIIDAYVNPVNKTSVAIDKLYSTTFVNDVDTASLSLIIPILLRSTTEKNAIFKRRATVIMDNLSKLVSDPMDALLFYKPINGFLTKIIDEVQYEEIRKVANNALSNISKLYNESDDVAEPIEQVSKIIKDATSCQDDKKIDYITYLLCFLIKNRIPDIDEWKKCIMPYFDSESVFTQIYEGCSAYYSVVQDDYESDVLDLCNIEFSLAYGSIVLLHKTKLHLKLGRKYALVGPNGAGKSTLMKSIANGTLSGFPEDIKTCYVAHEIQGSNSESTCVEYIMEECGISEEEARKELTNFRFDEFMQNKNICSLSGGWKMKLSLSKAIISKASLLLLDEPTNHLDYLNVRWLTEYLQQLENVSCLIVSHEPSFIDAVCTDVIHYEKNKKLKKFKGNLSDFIKIVPEAKSYSEIKDPEKKFTFPDPGYLEGVKSLTKAILKMTYINFTYPGAPKPQLIDVSSQCSLASRVAIVGVNGAGKSTLIKVLLGELMPDTGEVYKHPNLRVAYISQYSFKNVEDHLNKTPVQYIQWRYSAGVDKESLAREALKVSDEEEEARKKKLQERKLEVVDSIVGRKYGKRDFEYEVKWENFSLDNSYLTKTELEEMGYEKMVMEFDEKLASERLSSGKKLTTGEIQKHLEGFGISPEIGTHNYISALSGGQKMKVAFAAAFWYNPHLLIADEPSNFLDRESLASLITAINEFKGGVVIISHNRDFTQEICPETWTIANNRITVEGAEWMAAVEQARKREEKEAAKRIPKEEETKYDSFGNIIVEDKAPKELDRKQRKVLEKKRKEMIKNGEDTFDIDTLLGL